MTGMGSPKAWWGVARGAPGFIRAKAVGLSASPNACGEEWGRGGRHFEQGSNEPNVDVFFMCFPAKKT